MAIDLEGGSAILAAIPEDDSAGGSEILEGTSEDNTDGKTALLKRLLVLECSRLVATDEKIIFI